MSRERKAGGLPPAVARAMREMRRQQAAYDAAEPQVREPWPEQYDVGWLNRLFSCVLVGGTSVIVMETPEETFYDRLRLLKVEGFKTYLGNRFVERTGLNGKLQNFSWAAAWLEDEKRRTYDGLTFYPDAYGAAGPTGYLNLWRGFSVEPKRGGSYAILRDHLLTNIAHGDQNVFNWIFGWFAQLVQRPREKPGTALVFRGPMGVGKTKVGEVFGSLIRSHYFLVDDPRYIVGNFNVHMGSCLLLQADEAMWAGDKTAEGRLKGLITSDFQMIEAKNVDPVRMPNFIRVLMTSNEDWIVPAGKDERRFAVFDVDPRCAGNHDYFAEMDAELDAGGREALLADLLDFDLSKVNLRTIPKTGALLEQKIRSLDPIETWLLDRLKAGRPTRKFDHWPEFISTDVWCDDYVDASDRVGIRRKAAQTSFGIKIRKLLPDIRPGRKQIATETGATTERVRGFILPDLQRCRERFSELLGQRIEWEFDDDD